MRLLVIYQLMIKLIINNWLNNDFKKKKNWLNNDLIKNNND